MKTTVAVGKTGEIVSAQMSEALQILEKVNHFYSDSFSQLLYTMSGTIAFIGILVPVVFTFYQNSKLKLEKASLEKYVDDIKLELESSIQEIITIGLEKEKKELEAALDKNKKEIDEALGKSKKKLDMLAWEAKGGSCFVQGNNLYVAGEYNRASESYISAIKSFIRAEDEANLQRVLKVMANEVLPEMNKDVLKAYPKIKSRIDDVIEGLTKLNVNGRYRDIITKLELEVDQMLERTP